MDHNLLECWTEDNLENLANFIDYRGKTPVKTSSGISLITAKNIKDGYINREPREFIALTDYDNWMTRGTPKIGDVLITTEAPMGNVALVNISEMFALAQRAICLQFYYHGIGRYAQYALRSPFFQRVLKANSTGTTVSGIKAGTLKKLRLPIPPLAEQKVIAEKLDTLLALVDNTKARLERIPEILKRFRQSVLAAAVSGKLTEEWRIKCNIAQTKYCDVDEIVEFRGRTLAILPENWQWLRFDQVADIASNLVNPFDNLNAIHIAPNHIESWTGVVSGYQTIKEDAVTSAKHRFKKGQVLYSKIRPYLAKVAIAEFDGLCSADMYPINSLIDRDFLFRWMLTSEFTEWASNAESRSVLPKINQKDLSKIPVPTPPITEQTEIVRRVEELFAFADRIEHAAQAALSRVNNLTQSILAKAFRGELTADWRAANPELISGEHSAEALLARIKAERAKVSIKKSRKVATVD